ncbi:MAG: hypothetical protein RIR70_1687 [Pseudomonadota bacterium]|jgi:ankyrin repeat protein
MRFLRWSLLCSLVMLTAPGQAQTLDNLLRAARNGDASQILELLERGAWLDTVDQDGNTLLMQAIAANENGLADILIGAGAKLDGRNRHGDSALQIAALNGNRAMAKRLLETGAHTEQPGWTALHYAAFSGHADIVADLIAHTADVDAIAPNGASALMLAARNGHLNVVEALLRASADLNIRAQDGATAITWAKQAGNTDIADKLLRAGARE